MTIVISTGRSFLNRIIYFARYTPDPLKENQDIWFGYTSKHKKTGQLKFVGGRKPTPQTRSGITRKEAVDNLMSYIGAAYAGWEEYNV